MSLELTNPQPNPPVMGMDFSITATGGTASYTFHWRNSEGESVEVIQDEPTLTIQVPDGTAGQQLYICVNDSADQAAAWNDLIVSSWSS